LPEEVEMGLLVEGQWHDVWYATKSTGGRFVRKDAAFRNWITADGSAGPTGDGGRYHLYVSLACPWAHRTLIMRALKGLLDMISVSVVHWLMLERGWSFDDGPGVVGTVNFEHIKRHYYESHRSINPSGIVPVGPVLDFTSPHGRERLAAAAREKRSPRA
jgi:glutathionyl-hydroquinone reductase